MAANPANCGACGTACAAGEVCARAPARSRARRGSPTARSCRDLQTERPTAARAARLRGRRGLRGRQVRRRPARRGSPTAAAPAATDRPTAPTAAPAARRARRARSARAARARVSCQAGLDRLRRQSAATPRPTARTAARAATPAPRARSARRARARSPARRGSPNCGGTCVDLRPTAANCGACGTACAAGEVCSGGACARHLPAGLTNCGGRLPRPHDRPRQLRRLRHRLRRRRGLLARHVRRHLPAGSPTAAASAATSRPTARTAAPAAPPAPPARSARAARARVTCRRGSPTAAAPAATCRPTPPTAAPAATPARRARSAPTAPARSPARRAHQVRRHLPRPHDRPGQLRRLRQRLRRGPGLQQRDLRAVLPGGAHQLRRHLPRPHDRPRQLRRLRHRLRRGPGLQRRDVRGLLPGGPHQLRRQLPRHHDGPRQLRRLRHGVPGGPVCARAAPARRRARRRSRCAAPRCVDPRRPANCGACGTVCAAPAASTATCLSSNCGSRATGARLRQQRHERLRGDLVIGRRQLRPCAPRNARPRPMRRRLLVGDLWHRPVRRRIAGFRQQREQRLRDSHHQRLQQLPLVRNDMRQRRRLLQRRVPAGDTACTFQEAEHPAYTTIARDVALCGGSYTNLISAPPARLAGTSAWSRSGRHASRRGRHRAAR